ncbi:MAG: bifunctional phosphopantothenoylcysteine decarboxylase/phosphopantothenate--cysteine ligase CoaBC [Rhodothermales bacterium]
MPDRELTGKKLLLGVSGSIAAYKAAELVRLLKKSGAEVQVLMTEDAARFIPRLTLGTLSERDVLTEIFPEHAEGSWTQHVTLGLWADLFVIAPATAQTLAKLAHGFSDSMLTATALSARCPLLVCPAMDHDMYRHPATQANLGRMRQYGYEVMEPGYGALASGLTGYGRMPEPEDIARRVAEKLRTSGHEEAEPTLAGRHVLVTAGPTREALDPVRFLSNPSTGAMGFALAAAAHARGADVTLVSGPTVLETPPGVRRIDVTTADEMHGAVQANQPADLVFAAAAVSDYAPARTSEEKIKKGEDDLVLHLRRTPDVLAELGRAKRPGQTLVGFALETHDGLENARRKLTAKNLDWIVLNVQGEDGAGFGDGTNRVTLLSREGDEEALPLMPKADVARAILERVLREGERKKGRKEERGKEGGGER